MKDNKIFNALVIVLIVFLVSVTVLVNVTISNTVKEAEFIGVSDNFRNTISVSGFGEVFAEPNMGTAIFTVINENKDVRRALSENTVNSNRLIEFLTESGIEEKDMKTISFNITPRYDFVDRNDWSPGRRILAGYQVNHSLEVKIREIDQTGVIVEGAVNAGANDVSGIRFVVEDEEEYRNKSRAMAVEDAKRKAEELASQLGVDLVSIIGYNESESPISFDAMTREVVGMGGAPDIQTGENVIRTNVTVNYEIR